MRVVINITNHKLNEKQLSEISERFGNADIINITDYVTLAVDPNCKTILDSESNSKLISDIKMLITELSKQGEPLVLLQTEPGLQDYLLQFCRHRNIKTFHATTERKSKEITQEDGTVKKVSTFEHICFREYVSYFTS